MKNGEENAPVELTDSERPTQRDMYSREKDTEKEHRYSGEQA